MARLCERPGCSAPASVAYGFEAERYLVFLQPFDPELAESVRAGVLCRRHADALTPPRGWWLDDRRDAWPRLFVPRTPAPDPSHFSQRTRTARTRRPKSESEPTASPTLFDDPSPDQGDSTEVPTDVPTESPPVDSAPPAATSAPPPSTEPPAPTAPPAPAASPISDPAAASAEPPSSGSPAPVDQPDTDLEETRAMPWVPAFDAADDLAGLLRARSPLLSRAFGTRPDKPL